MPRPTAAPSCPPRREAPAPRPTGVRVPGLVRGASAALPSRRHTTPHPRHDESCLATTGHDPLALPVRPDPRSTRARAVDRRHDHDHDPAEPGGGPLRAVPRGARRHPRGAARGRGARARRAAAPGGRHHPARGRPRRGADRRRAPAAAGGHLPERARRPGLPAGHHEPAGPGGRRRRGRGCPRRRVRPGPRGGAGRAARRSTPTWPPRCSTGSRSGRPRCSCTPRTSAPCSGPSTSTSRSPWTASATASRPATAPAPQPYAYVGPRRPRSTTRSSTRRSVRCGPGGRSPTPPRSPPSSREGRDRAAGARGAVPPPR